jgi:DNA repair photolyase
MLREAGVPVGVFVAPVIPGLNESEIPEILRLSSEAGAMMAAFMPLRLPRPVDAVFFKRLRETMPHRVKRVENRIRDTRDGRLNDARFGHRMRGQGAYWESVRRLFDVSARRFGLSTDCRTTPQRSPKAAQRRQFTFGFASE